MYGSAGAAGAATTPAGIAAETGTDGAGVDEAKVAARNPVAAATATATGGRRSPSVTYAAIAAIAAADAALVDQGAATGHHHPNATPSAPAGDSVTAATATSASEDAVGVGVGRRADVDSGAAA